MARLSRRGRPDDRGQILVVGALAIALLLVVLAFALNGAAVTETLATDLDENHDARDATRFRAAADGAVADLVVTVNRENNTSRAALDAALSNAVADWDRLAARGAAGEGAATEVTLTDSTYRFSARQTNENRTFTDANGSANWTVAREVTTTRSFRMNVSRPALAGDCTGGCFQVVANNSSDTWRASFTANATNVTVTVDGPDGTTTTCTAATNTARVNLSGGRLDGAPCAPLNVTAALEGDYEVRYQRADLTEGTYELVVINATVDDAHFADDADPTLSPALYAATVTVSYRTERLTYAAEFRVVPGEDDG